MQTNKQVADGGNDSVIYQANGDIIINKVDDSLILEKIKTVSLDVFKVNFYDLGEDVRQIANRRAEEITNEFLMKLQLSNDKIIEKTADPDIRYDLFEVQKAYARFGDKEMADLLVDVLVQRTEENASFSKIVLNEALSVIPKLTQLQIDILTLLYVIERVSYTNPKNNSLGTFYDAFLAPFLPETLLPKNEYVYTYLQSCGCLTIILGGALKLTDVFKSKFKELNMDTELTEQEIREYPKLDAFEKSWAGESLLDHCSLSSIGLVIANTNFNLKTGNKFTLEHLINET